MSNKQTAIETANTALAAAQEFTKVEFPIGTQILSKRGRGDASFKVVGYPSPESIELVNSVLGESKNGKIQILNLSCVKIDQGIKVSE